VLTKRLVDAATPRQTEYQLFDGEIPGLALAGREEAQGERPAIFAHPEPTV
jgi:hypothetical protein